MLLKRKRPEDAAEGATNEEAAGSERASLLDASGLYHLWFLEMRLQEEIARSARLNRVFSVVSWELHLLPGEAATDEFVQNVSQVIRGALRTYDIATRVDGERFAAILLDSDYRDASNVGFRIKSDLQLKLRSAGRWRAGVASFPADGVDGAALVKASVGRLDRDGVA